MPQINDSNGNLLPGVFSRYGTGQSVAYTGTAGVIAGAVHTPKGTLTSTGVIPTTITDTVTIGNKTYTFKTALTPTEGEVLIGGSAAAALLNLIRAINHTGTPDTDYKCAAAHTQVTADVAVTASVRFNVYAIAADASIATSVAVTTRMSWGAATMGGLVGSGRSLVLIMLSTAGFIAIGPNPTATVTDIPMAAGIPQFFVVSPGDKVSAIQSAANGTLNVIEVE